MDEFRDGGAASPCEQNTISLPERLEAVVPRAFHVIFRGAIEFCFPRNRITVMVVIVLGVLSRVLFCQFSDQSFQRQSLFYYCDHRIQYMQSLSSGHVFLYYGRDAKSPMIKMMMDVHRSIVLTVNSIWARCNMNIMNESLRFGGRIHEWL